MCTVSCAVETNMAVSYVVWIGVVDNIADHCLEHTRWPMCTGSRAFSRARLPRASQCNWKCCNRAGPRFTSNLEQIMDQLAKTSSYVLRSKHSKSLVPSSWQVNSDGPQGIEARHLETRPRPSICRRVQEEICIRRLEHPRAVQDEAWLRGRYCSVKERRTA